jgi:hypothetical protein
VEQVKSHDGQAEQQDDLRERSGMPTDDGRRELA